MKRILFHMLCAISYVLRPIRHGFYMRVLQKAYEIQGVKFNGYASYIHHDAYIDNIGKVVLGDGIVVSTKAILLAHDYSHKVIEKAIGGGNSKPYISTLTIGDNVFIGAGAIILPGSVIGDNCIIGAGAVVKGIIPPKSVVAGNPGRVIKEIK